MPKKKKVEQTQVIKEQIQNENLENIIENDMMKYSMSVILDRAIPDVRDGLKPVQRRILYAMDKEGTVSSSSRKKSLNTVGTVMGRYHPHGDSSIYDAMVRMASENETLLTPLIDGKGNFGKHYLTAEDPAAARYCVTGDTLIPTENGFKFIKNISRTDSEETIDLTVKSVNYLTKADKFFNSGKHNIIKITLRNGMTLSGSYNHPVLTSVDGDKNNLQWTTLEKIKVSDKVLLDLGYQTCFGKNNDFKEAIAFAAAFSVKNLPDSKKEAILQSLKDLKIDRRDYSKISVESGFLSGSENYFKVFFNMLLKYTNSYWLKLKKKRQSGLQIELDDKFSKYVQLVLASNFGINSILVKKGIVIPNNYVIKFNSLFNTDDKVLVLKKVKKFTQITNTPDFSSVMKIEKLEPETVYSLRIVDKQHCFASNGVFSHNTEARLSPISQEFTNSLKKIPEIMIPNYDNTTVEPIYMPCTFPNILAGSIEGIAVGLASKIPGFNLIELCDATIERIKHPRKKIIDIMPAPDFTTGEEILYEKDVMNTIYETGQGSIKLRAKYTVDEKKRIIRITGIPFSTGVEPIVDSVAKFCKLGKIREISDINNTTGLNGMEITIDYKKDVDPHNLMTKLFALTPLQSTYSCNFNVLIDNSPRSVGVYQILDAWIANRRLDVEKELQYDLKSKEDNLHLLQALEKILLDIDKCIKIIRKSKNDEEVISGLVKGFKIDKIQAEYVADIKLRNLNKDYILNKTKNIKDLKEEIKQLKTDIKSGIDKIIIKQLKEISKKYGNPRKTEIVYNFTETSSKEFDVKENFQSKYIYTNDGYIKKIPLDIYKDSSVKFKSGDSERFSFDGDENSEILLFSNTGRVHKLYGSKVKNQKNQDTGELLLSMVDLEPGEDIIFINPLEEGWFVFCFENGKVAKITSSSYKTDTMRKVLKNGFNKKQKLIKMYFSNSNDDIFTITSTQDKKISFSLSLISERQTSSSDGMYVLRAKGAFVKSFSNKLENSKYLVSKVPVSGVK